jgi:hypothetical protein
MISTETPMEVVIGPAGDLEKLELVASQPFHPKPSHLQVKRGVFNEDYEVL